MKKLMSLLFIICIVPFLCGCGGMRKQFRRVEQMLVVQALGLDKDENGVRLTLASAADSSKKAACLSGSGKTISAALERIRNYSFEEDIFCAHVGHVLIGEDAGKDGVEDVLSYICHSPELRIDLPVYIIREGRAEDTISSIGGDDKGITELMDSIRSAMEHRGDGNVFTAAEILGSTERNGSALVCAIEYAPASEKPPEEGEEELKTAAVQGYGVLKNYKLVKYIDSKDAVAVGFLLGDAGICELEVQDNDGRTVTLEIDSGSAKILPVWNEDGYLKGIDVQAKASASVLETAGRGADFDNAKYANYLVAQLEKELSERIGNVLRLSKTLRADFLGLAAKLEHSEPQHYRAAVGELSELLPSLELRVSVRGRLSHTNDLKDT